jgi:hypothetical protein
MVENNQLETITLRVFNSLKSSIRTCDMKMPGSLAPKGIHEWSVPPIILNPKEPPSFTSVTSCNYKDTTENNT